MVVVIKDRYVGNSTGKSVHNWVAGIVLRDVYVLNCTTRMIRGFARRGERKRYRIIERKERGGNSNPERL